MRLGRILAASWLSFEQCELEEPANDWPRRVSVLANEIEYKTIAEVSARLDQNSFFISLAALFCIISSAFNFKYNYHISYRVNLFDFKSKLTVLTD